MNFPIQLSRVFKGSVEEQSTKEDGIKAWNEEIEAFLGAHPSQDQSKIKSSNDSFEQDITSLAKELYEQIVNSILPSLDGSLSSDAEREEVAHKAKQHYVTNEGCLNIERCSYYIRASKNLLRWYIQIYLEMKVRRLPCLVRCLQSPAMVALLVSILETEESNSENGQQDRARNISLYLFYATYSPFSGDADSEKALKHLIFDLKFTEIALRILTRPCTPALALSLVRNLHTALVSLQGANKVIAGTEINCEGSYKADVVGWLPKESCCMTFTLMCISLMRWSLDSKPSFPGDKDDKRINLIMEALGALYALRIDPILSLNNGDPKLLQLVLDILSLPDNMEDKRFVQCKVSVISLLMDSDRSIGEKFLKNDAFASLLKVLETQVNSVIEKTKVDDSAAASLVPILVVLNKFAASNAEVRKSAKLYVFPVEAESGFEEKARMQHNATSKNMSPLDAPKGTFRHNLISLMTWPQGHIKRCTGELLWTLCSSDATEFVYRVGIGNGMPILGVKGIVQIPQQRVTQL
jgi:hypothetical protein